MEKQSHSAKTISLRQLLLVCGNLGVCAGEILREVHEARLKGGKEGLKMVDKGAAKGTEYDPQTIADRRSERLIVNGLRQAFGPHLCVVGEESGLAPGKQRDEEAEQDEDDVTAGQLEELENIHERMRLDWWDAREEEDMIVDMSRVAVWIDPLDATREYTDGNVEFCTVLVGITIDGRSSAGVMVEPFAVDRKSGKSSPVPICWWGIKHKGCWKTVVGTNESTRVEFKRKEPFQAGVNIAVSRSRAGGVVQQFASRYTSFLESYSLDFSISFSGGCGYKILLILKEAADLYPFPCSGTSMWDSCAGDALLDAAGGLLTDKYGRRLVYNPTGTGFSNQNGLLAANDERICRFTSESIASCLDFTRDLNYQFFSNETVARILRVPRIFFYETPSNSLVVERSNGIVEYDLVATCDDATREKRRLRCRRFDPSHFVFDQSTTLSSSTEETRRRRGQMIRILCKRSAEAHFLDEIIPSLAKENIRFEGTVRFLERSTSRRPPTLSEIIARYQHDPGSFSKLYLQSLAYVFMFEPIDQSTSLMMTMNEERMGSFQSQVAFLKRFHGFFWERQDLAQRVAEFGWRWSLSSTSSSTLVEKGRANKLAVKLKQKVKGMRDRVNDVATSSVIGEDSPRSEHAAVLGKVSTMTRDEEEAESEEDLSQKLYEVVDRPVQQKQPIQSRRRRTVIRGMFRRSPCALDDLSYCAVVSEPADEPSRACLQDLVHLLMLNVNDNDEQANRNNLDMVKQVYFARDSKAEELIIHRRLKEALLQYGAALLSAPPVFFEAFRDVAVQTRVLNGIELLCDELESLAVSSTEKEKSFNGTDMRCFGAGTEWSATTTAGGIAKSPSSSSSGPDPTKNARL